MNEEVVNRIAEILGSTGSAVVSPEPSRSTNCSTIFRGDCPVSSAGRSPVVNRHKSFYSVPRWCRMHPMEHFDGMGGCWGIHYGLVDRDGRDYCKRCAFYRRNAERVDPWTFESQVARNAVAKMEAEASRPERLR